MFITNLDTDSKPAEMSVRPEDSSALTDAQLWQAFRMGNDMAYSSIYRDHARLLYSYAMRLVNDHDLVMDAIQDLFVEIWDARERLGDVRSIKSYLISSIRRKVLHASAKIQKKSKRIDENTEMPASPSVEQTMIDDDASSHNIAQLQKSIARLKPEQQEIIYLKYYGRLSYDEIAEILSSDKKAVYNLMARTIKLLRDSFDIYACWLCVVGSCFFR